LSKSVKQILHFVFIFKKNFFLSKIEQFLAGEPQLSLMRRDVHE